MPFVVVPGCWSKICETDLPLETVICVVALAEFADAGLAIATLPLYAVDGALSNAWQARV